MPFQGSKHKNEILFYIRIVFTTTMSDTTAMTEERKRALTMGAMFAIFGLVMLGMIVILGMDLVGK